LAIRIESITFVTSKMINYEIYLRFLKMAKREIFEETDYLIDLLIYNKVYENPEEYEDLIDSILDRMIYLRELLKYFD